MARKNDAARYIVSGVCCASEEAVLKKRLDTLIGPGTYSYNPVTCELRVSGAVPEETVVSGVREAGFGARQRRGPTIAEPFYRRHMQGFLTGFAALVAVVGATLVESGALMPGKVLLLCAILVGGWKAFLKAFAAVRQRALDMNVLMTLAVIGALAINKWEEGAAVIILFSISLMLEGYSTTRARRAVGTLMELSPEEAVVVRGGKEQTVPAASVHVGERILARPGARIPLDGTVVDGESTVSEAMLTGEPTPVPKGPGTEVYAGCLNGHGALTVEVRHAFEDTRLAHIIELIEEAQHQRAPVQTSIERFAGVYTWGVLGVAVAVAAIPPLLFAQPFVTWLYRALVLLVIACPCALVISTPVTLVSALTAAARSGILVKGGRHLETLSRIRAIAFDKTGTLTEGRLQVTDVVPLNGMPRERLLELLAAIEQRSEHHLASAVIREAALSNADVAALRVERFEALPGRGARALVNGESYYLGNHALSIEQRFDAPLLAETMERLEGEGKTVMVLGRQHEALGILAVRDATRREGRAVIDDLRALGVDQMVVLSGDTGIAVERLGDEIGLDRRTGKLMPGDKVQAVKSLEKEYGHVAMVGDGINDAPALAAASVGIAMGAAGTDAALETADVVLMADGLRALPPLIRISRKAVGIIRQNITFALAVKLLFLVMSIMGVATLWMALLADDGAALAVILNGLRALKRPALR